MYLLLLENYLPLGGGRFDYHRKIYTHQSLETIYQYLEHELFKHLNGEDSDDYWNEYIYEFMDTDCGFFIYEYAESGENKLLFESLGEKTWSDFYNFCFKKNESILRFSNFIFESKDKFPNIKKMEIDGFQVLMGRDALSNDYLTVNMANEDDLWFHAKGVPGSHIIIRVKDFLPTEETIKNVAILAAKNSKSNGKTPVVYCKSKYVKKSSDMKPGKVSVDYKNSNEIVVEI